MSVNQEHLSRSWFRGRGGRRFALEFALIIACKLVLLGLLWAFFFKPQLRADTSPAAIQQHFSIPSPVEPAR